MRVIHNAFSLANGSGSLSIFGPFEPLDEIEALLIHWYVSDAAATIRMGTKQANDQGVTFLEQSSGSAMLLPAIASGAGYEVLYPLLETFRESAEARYFAVFLDNSGGAATISGLMMLQVRRAS